MAPRPKQRGFESIIIPVAPVHQTTEQIAQAVFGVGACHGLKCPQRCTGPLGTIIVHILWIGW